MSLQTRLDALIAAIGADVKSLQNGRVAWVNSVAEADALPAGTLAIILAPAETTPTTTKITTWTGLVTASETKPVVIAHRGAGEDIGLDGALSSVDLAIAEGLNGYMIVDGGDGRVTSDGVLVVSHDDVTGELFDTSITISTSTLAQFKALKFKDFPLYRGTISTENPPTMQEYIQKCKDVGIFTVPEIKTTGGASLVVSAVQAVGSQANVQVQAFAATAAEADARLGPAKDAGISVGLLQSPGNNIGFPAITTCVRGGAPDVVLYDPDPADATTFTDAWLQSAINAGIKLQCGTAERRHIMNEQQSRVQAMGGRITLMVSDDPLYTAGANTVRNTDRFKTHWFEHGFIRSNQTALADRPRIDVPTGRLRFHNSAANQATLLGAFCGTEMWKSIQYTIHWEGLDSTTSRWFGLFFAKATDQNYHDGTDTGDGNNLACLIRQDGVMRLYRRQGNTSTLVAGSLSTDPAGTASSTTNSPFTTAGASVQILLERLYNGTTALNQFRITRTDTGQTVTAPADSMPVWGPYMHAQKNGTTGSVIGISDITITR